MPPVFGTDVRKTVLDTHMGIPASETTTTTTPNNKATTTTTPNSDGLFPDANPANV
jgi:hypothetical protein